MGITNCGLCSPTMAVSQQGGRESVVQFMSLDVSAVPIWF